MSALLIAVTSVFLSIPFGMHRLAEATPLHDRQVQRSGSSAPSDTLEARRLAADAVQRFLMAWRKEWVASERNRLRHERARSNPNLAKAERTHWSRTLHAHCHSDGTNIGSILSINGAFGKCPSWLLTDSLLLLDESHARDAGISPPARANIRDARTDLLVTLDSLQQEAPRDVFLVGQRVRFMVDAGRLDEATYIATRCIGDTVWCTLLRGYTLAMRGRTAAADSAFEVVTKLLPPASRCEWTDVESLFYGAERKTHRTRSCADRDSLAVQYWWLARPLLSDLPGPHVRRVEHYRRKVLVLLHASLPFNELHDMRPSHGGDAVAELLLRYGWPTLTAWAGDTVDKSHDEFLFEAGVPFARPYTTAEYSPGRVRFGAALSAVLDPFRADTSAWDLRPPPHKTEDLPTGPSSPRTWWPVEHMRYPGGAVTQLPAGQTGFFRRPNNLRVLAAVETGDALQSASSETPRAMLVASPAPDSVTIIAESPVSSAGRVELGGEINARPMLIGIESTGTPSHPLTARTRFGAVPPPPLDSLPRGEIAISQPVFFEATESQPQPGDLNELSRAMLGSTAVQEGSKVGLFWETYGAAASDSVRFAVKVSRVEAVGLLQRIGAALRLVELPVSSVAVAWDEVKRPEQNAASNTLPTVSIATGTIVLDVSTLSRGTYMIEVTASVPGRADARAGRVLTVR